MNIIKIGSLVKDKRGNIGIVTNDLPHSVYNRSRQSHVRVHWTHLGLGTEELSIHIRNLEVICK